MFSIILSCVTEIRHLRSRGFGNCGVFLAGNYVSEQFGNYVEYGKCVRVLANCHFGNVHTAWVTKTVVV